MGNHQNERGSCSEHTDQGNLRIFESGKSPFQRFQRIRVKLSSGKIRSA